MRWGLFHTSAYKTYIFQRETKKSLDSSYIPTHRHTKGKKFAIIRHEIGGGGLKETVFLWGCGVCIVYITHYLYISHYLRIWSNYRVSCIMQVRGILLCHLVFIYVYTDMTHFYANCCRYKCYRLYSL